MSFINISEKTPGVSAPIWSVHHTMEPNPPVSPTHRTSPSSFTPLKPVDAMRRARALHATQQAPSALGLDTLDVSRSTGLWSDIKYIASSGNQPRKTAAPSRRNVKPLKSRLLAGFCLNTSRAASSQATSKASNEKIQVITEKSPLLLPSPVIYSASDAKLQPVLHITKLNAKDSDDSFFSVRASSSSSTSAPSAQRVFSHRRVPVPSLSSDDESPFPTSTLSRFPVTPNTPATRPRSKNASLNALGLTQVRDCDAGTAHTSHIMRMPLTPPPTQRFDQATSLCPSPPRRHMRLLSYDTTPNKHSGSDEFERKLEARRVRHSTDTFGPAPGEPEDAEEASSWYSSEDEEGDDQQDDEESVWGSDDEMESSSEEEFDRIAAMLRHAEAATPMTRVSSEERLKALEIKYGSAL